MKKSRLVVCVLSALLLTNGCHPISVKTAYDHGANFAGRKIYAWQATTNLDTGDPRFDTQRMAREIRSTVEATLAAKGFQKTDSVHPDFLVGYAANIEFKANTLSDQRTFGNASWGWVRTDSKMADYETGALVLEMTDPITKRILWQAVASAVVMERASAVERQARIGKAVRKMLDDFPPQ